MRKINTETIVRRAQNLSNVRMSYKTFTPYGGHVVDTTQVLRVEEVIKKSASTSFNWLKEKPNWTRVLFSLDNKQFNAFCDIISQIDKCDKRADASLEHSQELSADYAELSSIHQKALKEMWTNFESLYNSKVYSRDEIDGTWQNMDNASPSRDDLELVQAFDKIGVKLEWKNGEWEDKTTRPANPISFEDKYVFEKTEIEKLLGGYLNAPLAERGGKRITPEGLFRVYEERAKQKIQSDENVSDFDKDTLRRHLAEKTKEHQIKGDAKLDWEIELLTNPDLMKLNAKKVAFGEIALGIVTGDMEDLPLQYSSELQEEMVNSTIYQAVQKSRKNSGIDRDIISRLRKQSVRARDSVQDNLFGIDGVKADLASFVSAYDDKITNLQNALEVWEKNNANPKMVEKAQKQIDALGNAREEFLANVELMKGFVKENKTTNRQNMLDELNEVVENYWVKSNGGDFTMIEPKATNIADERTETAQRLIDLLNEKYKKSGLQGYTQSKTSQSGANLETGEWSYEDYVINLDAMHQLQSVEMLFAEGCPLYDGYKNFRLAHQNENKTIHDYYAEIHQQLVKDNDPNADIWTEEMFVAGYEHAMYNRAKEKGETPKPISPTSQKTIDTIEQDFDDNMFRLDRAMRLLNNDQGALSAYNSPNASEEDRAKILREKLVQANNALKNIDRGSQEYQDAVNRQKNPQLVQFLKEDEEELENSGEPIPALANTLDKHVQKLNAEQPKQKTEYKLYKDFKHSTVDKDKFEKAMKKYNAKDLKKHFFKPLLKSIATKTKINMEAYYAKNKGSANPYIVNHKPENIVQEEQEEQIPQEEPVVNNTEEPAKQGEESQNKQPNQSVLTQRQNEALSFMPGLCLIEKAMEDIKKEKGDNSSEYKQLKNLQNVFITLSRTDDINHPMCRDIEDGTDFRDACRGIAFDICKGELKNYGDVRKRLGQVAQKYNIDVERPFFESMDEGFKYLTPELMNYMFEFSSKCQRRKSSEGVISYSISLGGMLPKDLDKCKTDKERKECVEYYMNRNLVNYQEGAKLFNMLVNDIYKDGAQSGFGRDGDEMEFDR